MVGPGTGIAAFRSIIQADRTRPMVLVFGCRGREIDYYYKEEWKKYDNLKVFEAFSRD